MTDFELTFERLLINYLINYFNLRAKKVNYFLAFLFNLLHFNYFKWLFFS